MLLSKHLLKKILVASYVFLGGSYSLISYADYSPPIFIITPSETRVTMTSFFGIDINYTISNASLNQLSVKSITPSVVGNNSTITSNITANNCDTLASQATCNVTVHLGTSKKKVSGELNLKVESTLGEGSQTTGINTVKVNTEIAGDCTPIPGIYTVTMFDDFADGWQTTNGGGGAGIMIDFVNSDNTITTKEIGLCSQWEPNGFLGGEATPSGDICTPGAVTGTTTVDIPTNTKAIKWTFPGDNYGEISFDIKNASGTVVGQRILPATNNEYLIDFTSCE